MEDMVAKQVTTTPRSLPSTGAGGGGGGELHGVLSLYARVVHMQSPP